jgi:hypothetical protein
MITKIQLRNLKDKNNHFTWTTEVNWQETGLARLYEHIDAQIEGGAVVDFVSAKPISFDKERETLVLEIVLDLTDLFEDDEDEEEIQHLGDGN